MSSPFPPEIIYEIALHLPLTEDILALSLTCHAIRRALSTPVLFKARLLLQGWDLDTWRDEDDDKAKWWSMNWKRWIQIDYIHSKTLQLLEDASTGNLFESPPLMDLESPSLTPTPKTRIITNTIRNPVIHFGMAESWNQGLSKVFPILISHHRVNNIPQITETKYCDPLRAYFLAVTETYIDMLAYWKKSHIFHIFPDPSSVCLQERACFGLTAFVMQCDATTIETIFFGDGWIARGSPRALPGLFSRFIFDDLSALFSSVSYRHPKEPTDIIGTSMLYSTAFLVQMKIRLGLHFGAARSALSLLPPFMPPMDPASQYDEPFDLGSKFISWPWLRDGLAGTPIVRLLSTSGDRWAGYYTHLSMEPHAPPMYLKLDLVSTAAVCGAAHKVYFLGEGTDSRGQFFLEGTADTHTGAVVARKSYVGASWWQWHGMVSPFGMVGTWGFDGETWGGWWIWPQEWSERSAASQVAES